MGTYVVNFTDISKEPISVLEQDVDNTSTDISLFGLIRLRYGEELQENLLHLLENYASPEDASAPGNPNLAKTYNGLLANPIEGQFWYNSSSKRLNQWNGSQWMPIRGIEDIAVNWGTIGHGQRLPRPVSQTTGYQFEYSECIWSVSPAAYDGYFLAMNCSTALDSEVTMQYRLIGTDTLLPGLVNYLIIGIRGNRNRGNRVDPPAISGVTPTPTPTIGAITPTPSITPTIDITPTVTTTVTPTPSITPTITPTPSSTALGINTRLYTSPSEGDPGGPGPGGVDVRLYNTCGPSVTIDDVQKSYYISLQNLSGGVPPYTVNFRWITTTLIDGWYYRNGEYLGNKYDLPPISLIRTYGGGFEPPSNYLRTGLTQTSLPQIRIQAVFDSPSAFRSDYTYFMKYVISGKVILTDSIGQTRTWWIPELPTIVGGSNITETDNPSEIPIPHNVSWWHYENCYDCPDCF